MSEKLKPFISGSSLSTNGKYYILSVRCSEEEMEKTKRLIASAPEMYEELCEALEFFKKEAFYSDEAKTYVKSIEKLIARIDGEEENDIRRGM